MTDYLFDASAILALVLDEPDQRVIMDYLAQSKLIGSVNLAEVIAKLADFGLDEEETEQALGPLGLEIVGFDLPGAQAAGALRRETREWGLSLGDRCCLALGIVGGYSVVTADRAWAKLKLSVPIIVTR